MKARILVSLCGVLLSWGAIAQSADDWIAQGRAALTAQNITNANAAFAQAVALSPTNETANALYAVTRLLVLPSQPAGSNFLTRLGFPLAGRNIYNWQSKLPKDTNGVPLAPSGVNADEVTAQLRTNVSLAVQGALGNLAAITHTNFTVNLASNETCLAAVTVDYGDLKLIQAGLFGAECLIYTLNAQNCDAQLSDLRALYTNSLLTASQVLAAYPKLLTYTAPADVPQARSAFTNAVTAYMVASALIRARPVGEVRLVNYDQTSARAEGDFRLTLQDLQNSLSLGPQWLALAPSVAVDATPLFTGQTPWRSLLPAFDGDAIELGSWPDLSFGETVYGLSQEELETALSKKIVMLPVGGPPVATAGNRLSVPFSTLTGHNYALLVSSNLVDWQVLTPFTASNAVSVCSDTRADAARFYRLRDDSAFLAVAGVVFEENTQRPIAGAQVQSLDDGTTTFTDTNGQFYLVTTLPANWGYAFLEISAAGYGRIESYFAGAGSAPSQVIYMAPPPPNDNFANRTFLSGSNVSTNGDSTGATRESAEPPDNGYGGKSVWFSWTAPTSASYQFSVSTSFDPILVIYTGSTLANLTSVAWGQGRGSTILFNASAGQTYQIELDAYLGIGGPYTLSIVP